MAFPNALFGTLFVLMAALIIGIEANKKRSQIISTIIQLAENKKEDLKTAPPSYDQEETTRVQVLLYVNSIDAVSEANMDFTVGILLHLQWVDPRIYSRVALEFFNENDRDSIDFDSENIKNVWVPDIFFPNEKRGSFHNIMTENRMMTLFRSGTILYISRLSVTLSCPMDLINYPFDKQTCHLLIMSFGFTDKDVVFDWMNATTMNTGEMDPSGKPVLVDKEVVLPQFEVKGVTAEYCRRRYHQKNGNHSCLQANFKLARNIGFYFVQMYIPSTLIVMLSWISFWLTVNSVPGRISLGLLTVLTMTTQSSSVNAALPRVSYTKAIDVWMSTCLVFVFAALLEFAVVNVLSRKDSIQGFSLKHAFTIPRELENRMMENEVAVPLDGFDNAEKKKGRFTKKGIIYATYLDIAARIFFPTCFITFIIIYWLYYVNTSE